MSDKSPRQNMSQKSSKSIKEKRREKSAKREETSNMSKLVAEKGHHRSQS
jgi:hypothetical protein